MRQLALTHMSKSKKIAATSLIIVVVCLYYRTLSFPYTNWDDFEFIRDNPLLQSTGIDSIERLITPGGVRHEMLYIPLTYLSYFVENIIWGLRPSVVHGTNVILHLTNTLLMLVFISSLSKNWGVAFIGSLAFAVHPLMVEPVAWCMGRKDLLSTSFGLGALITYYRFLTQNNRLFYWISVSLFIAGVLAKPTLIILPGLLLLIDRYAQLKSKHNTWLTKLPYMVLSLVAFSVSLFMPSDQAREAPTLMLRLLSLPEIVTDWGLRILLLQEASPFYCWPTHFDNQSFFLSFIVIMVITGLIAYGACQKRFKGLIFGFSFLMIASLPALSLILTPREFMTADRYGYFPLIGLFFGIASTMTELPNRLRTLCLALVSCWLIGATWVSSKQIEVWQDSVALWKRANQHCQNRALVYNNLGMAYLDAGQKDKAISVFRRGLEVNADYIPICNNLGILYNEQDRPEEAKEILRRAISLASNSAKSFRNLGHAHRKLNEFLPAIACYKKSIIFQPNHISSYLSLGNYLVEKDHLIQAELVYKKALKIDANNPDIYFGLGVAYEKQRLNENAIEAYQRAIVTNPNLVDAHYNLANIFSSQNRVQLAQREYLNVLKLAPQRLEATINLGNLYFSTGKMEKAENYYHRAINLGDDINPFPHYNLGLIYSRKNEFKQAVTQFKKALGAQPNFADAHYEIAKVYFRMDDTMAAGEHLKQAISLGVKADPKFVEDLKGVLK